ncbi:hypothetical protein C8R45DRAFT_1038315 [Mycena sanguinolenta]|nr:hypothetical protein C8R45DRAFT_1038315 [Mycena sanguinolenta]
MARRRPTREPALVVAGSPHLRAPTAGAQCRLRSPHTPHSQSSRTAPCQRGQRSSCTLIYCKCDHHFLPLEDRLGARNTFRRACGGCRRDAFAGEQARAREATCPAVATGSQHIGSPHSALTYGQRLGHMGDSDLMKQIYSPAYSPHPLISPTTKTPLDTILFFAKRVSGPPAFRDSRELGEFFNSTWIRRKSSGFFAFSKTGSDSFAGTY